MTIPVSGDRYVISNLASTTSAAISLIQLKAVIPLWIIRARLTQRGSVTSVQERVQLVRTTTAAAVTSVTPDKLDSGGVAAGAAGGAAASGINATAEGGGTVTVLLDSGFNVINGFEWIPTPLEIIQINAGEFFALKFPVAPATQNWSAQVFFVE